jgi:hypothetical protein
LGNVQANAHIEQGALVFGGHNRQCFLQWMSGSSEPRSLAGRGFWPVRSIPLFHAQPWIDYFPSSILAMVASCMFDVPS